MEDTIVIFPSAVITYDAKKTYPNTVKNPYLSSFWQDYYLFEYDLVYALLPFAEENFPVMKGAEHTAVCGLSMGCAQTMEIGFKHPELFDYMGCFLAGPYEDPNLYLIKNEEDAAKINKQMKLCFFITGEYDHLHEDSMRNFINICTDFGLNHSFYEVPKEGHSDNSWDTALYNFMRHAFK